MIFYRKFRLFPTAVSACALALAASCGGSKGAGAPDDQILVQAGDSCLLMADVLSKIPSGLAPEDSAAMFHQIVDSWLEAMVLADVAEKNIPDLDRIDRMADLYRRDLIVEAYLALMSSRYDKQIPESRIKAYYEANRSEMILSQPIVKGAYIKLPDTDPNLETLRQNMATLEQDASADRLEKSLRQASQYDYFREEWQDWGVIAERIPYRFFDADAFLKSTKDFETSDGGSTYLLHISEWIPSGETMPYDYARSRIASVLRAEDMSRYRASLIRDIYRDRIKEGWLRPGLYNPVESNSKSVRPDSVRTHQSKN